MKTKEVVCKLCKGTKVDPRKKGGKTPCPKCKGRGTVKIEVENE